MRSNQVAFSLLFLTINAIKLQDENYALKLIADNGFEPEVHTVKTLDNYILAVHRMRPKNLELSRQKPPIFIMHGIMGQSTEFLITGSESLAVTMAQNDYDIWLGNSRGTPPSMGHKTLSPNSSEYWNFSWHEIGFYDVPAMFDRMLEVTNSTSGFYIGHSQGSTVLLVFLSTRPEYNQKVIQAHLSAPPAYMDHFRHSLFHQFGRKFIETYSDGLKMDLRPLIEPILANYNKYDPIQSLAFLIVAYMLAGGNIYKVEINRDFFPLQIFSNFAPNVSAKQFLHYLQLVDSNKFREYDYGRDGNLARYNRTEAPEYNLKRIVTKIYIYCAQQDIVVSEKDVQKLRKALPNVTGYQLLRNYNHLDFCYGKNAKREVYRGIIQALEKLDQKNELDIFKSLFDIYL